MKFTPEINQEVAQVIIGIDQEVTRRMALKTVTAPPSIIDVEDLSIPEQVQLIMLNAGLDGMEIGDHPNQQRFDRLTVYQILSMLLKDGWSFKRCTEWLEGSISFCSVTLHGKIVRKYGLNTW